jgi:hypothetical protein
MTLHEGGKYEIRLGAHLDARWAAAFDGLDLRHENDGTTTLYGPVVDQAALHGVLSRVRDLAVPLISVNQVDPDRADAPGSANR